MIILLQSNNNSNIVIVGYTDDGNCEYYVYYDTSDGEYKLIDQSDITLYYVGLYPQFWINKNQKIKQSRLQA